ncbi:MAG: hypothetical protein KAH14_06495 [Clostridiales bacterium]|nr:hypothetical protein [Clostridiales bacterium]
MKSKTNTVLTVIFAVVVLMTGFIRSAAGADIVLASVDYVDSKFNELNLRISQISTGGTSTGGTVDSNTLSRINNLEVQTGALQNDVDDSNKRVDFMDTTMRNISDGTVWQVIKVDPGIRVLASDTGEVILRSGTARVIGNEYNEGISDLTSGVEVKNGELITKDHHLLIPRGDGRGIITETVCYIIYKGLYYMQ